MASCVICVYVERSGGKMGMAGLDCQAVCSLMWGTGGQEGVAGRGRGWVARVVSCVICVCVGRDGEKMEMDGHGYQAVCSL